MVDDLSVAASRPLNVLAENLQKTSPKDSLKLTTSCVNVFLLVELQLSQVIEINPIPLGHEKRPIQFKGANHQDVRLPICVHFLIQSIGAAKVDEALDFAKVAGFEGTVFAHGKNLNRLSLCQCTVTNVSKEGVVGEVGRNDDSK